MAMAGLAVKNLQQKVSSSSLLNPQTGNRRVAAPQQQCWDSGISRRLSTPASEKFSNGKSSQGQEVAVSEGGSKKFKLSTSRPKRELWNGGLGRNHNRDLNRFSIHEVKEGGGKGEGSDDEYWSTTSYGNFSTFLLMPEDAKVYDIKAEMNNGVLTITIPKTQKPNKEVKIHLTVLFLLVCY